MECEIMAKLATRIAGDDDKSSLFPLVPAKPTAGNSMNIRKSKFLSPVSKNSQLLLLTYSTVSASKFQVLCLNCQIFPFPSQIPAYVGPIAGHQGV
jgi:hypothetical protein